MTMRLLVAALAVLAPVQASAEPLATQEFELTLPGEVVATFVARCTRCDWREHGRETALLELTLDGTYSQHVAVLRGQSRQRYTVLLGAVEPGQHTLTIDLDTVRSAPGARPVTVEQVNVREVEEWDPDYSWISRTPVLRARPGTVEHFSDFPLLMYVEHDVTEGEGPAPYSLQYTVIFSNEDGGTPSDRLMATWGRTTDIEFVFGVTASGGREVIQAEGHRFVDYAGTRYRGHPELWVATPNNMVADHGDPDQIRFAPSPVPVKLIATSREHVMDEFSWTYRIASAEMFREARVKNDAKAGSGFIVDPRHYMVIEACADVVDATLAFEVGFQTDNGVVWESTDRSDPAFRIARGGCFRAGAPLPPGGDATAMTGLRVRAFPRPSPDGSTADLRRARVNLTRIDQLFFLDQQFAPRPLVFVWSGSLSIPVDGNAVDIPLTR